jgi:hypothetical protein
MLTLPPSTRVFVATKPADMRRSFDGLLAIVRDFVGHDDRSPATSPPSATSPATGSRSSGGTATASPSSTRTKKHTAPIHSPLQNPANSPIIALGGLLHLAEWSEARAVAQGGGPCPKTSKSLLPPAPIVPPPAGARSTLDSADERPEAANTDDAQRHRRSPARRTSQRKGGAR